MTQWSFAAVLDAIAASVPERTMTRCGSRVRTFGAAAQDTTRLANFLIDQGLGVVDQSGPLQRWHCGQDRVALLMRNDRYPEAFLAATKARTAPVNVNYNYTAAEVADLLSYVEPRAVFYHRSFGPVVAQAVDPAITSLLISVDDGSDTPMLPDAVDYDTAVQRGDSHRPAETSPDDLVMICTGGTTGRPKGVLWRQGDMYVSSMGGADHPDIEAIAELARAGGQTWFPVSPLMHALGLWSAFAAILGAHTVVLHDDREPFDPAAVWRTAAHHQVSMMSIVGDAYAAPLAAELGRADYDLTQLSILATGGAATHPQHKRALVDRLPRLSIIDGYGSSETGGLGYGQSRSGQQSHTFAAWTGGVVLSEDRRRVLGAGDTEIGWAAKTGRIPMGYFNDPAATEATFPIVDGHRMSIPGDRARIGSDGTIELLGRDSLVVNTGGEKVFVEEVEEVLRGYAGVADAVVVGRPHPRWGHEVTAVIATIPGHSVDADQLRGHCRSQLAGFKTPKAFVFVDAVRRLGTGKADYRWAARAAAAGSEHAAGATHDPEMV
ncbi:AMP-binding protein [Mycobacterium sp. 852002-51057_SCH5723018]|uniref:AMP-binding protein n=1 Tax=Mycobacterium sp. 852002-51057_SCH5723018 TaxID=1834094 RepID=UPI0007FC3C2D|nr:AMP-binding protein [Mycobacterium sp. 852002-51057_SCH5723018]OBG30266.1 acyl-CoA synthetase [Mycobacterium sp. 852002-51057_SCH5723018]